MKRLTTDCPDNNLDAALNLFYAKDGETWVRGGGDGPDYPDIRLCDFIRKAAKILLPDLDFPMDDDGVDYAMGELLLDGPDEPTGLLALLYTAAWAYAELRGRLMQYEDTGLTPEEIKELLHDTTGPLHHKLGEWIDADASGRLVVLPCKVGTATYYIHYPIAVYPDKSEPEIKRGIFTLCDLDRVGHSVFLTHEEAEKALEAMKK